MTDPTDHDELRTLADKLDDIAQRAEEEHISGVRPALRKWDTDRLHAAADVLRDDLQRRQRAYLATKRLTAERDAERAARERAEAEARQLRQAVMEAATELGLTHEPEWASPAAKEKGLNPVWCAICGSADGSWPCTSQMVLDDLLAAVAEGAEDRRDTE